MTQVTERFNFNIISKIISKTLYFGLCALLAVMILAILPKSCDTEYQAEHPTYISPADQVIIDIQNHQGE